MASEQPFSQINAAELMLGTALVWKLLTDELCARDQTALKSLTANLDEMITLLRSGDLGEPAGVVAAMTLFRAVLTADLSVDSLLKSLEKSQGGSTH